MSFIVQELLYKKEVFRIIGAAMEVHNQLGQGFLEAVYHEALETELKEQKIPYESQKKITILYKEKPLKKEYIADLLCFKDIIVELKAIKKITEIEEAQLLNYLKATGCPLGLIINFGSSKMEWKRFVYSKSLKDINEN